MESGCLHTVRVSVRTTWESAGQPRPDVPIGGGLSDFWLLQLSPIWIALAGGFVPALIAARKRRTMSVWYLYGFACTLVAWPLLASGGTTYPSSCCNSSGGPMHWPS